MKRLSYQYSILAAMWAILLSFSITSCDLFGKDDDDDKEKTHSALVPDEERKDEPVDNTLYRIPCLQWGASKSTVKNFMNGYTLLSGETENLIAFDGKYKEAFTAYLFRDGKLVGSDVCFDKEVIASRSTLENKLQNDKYQFVDYLTDGSPLYLSSDEKTVVIIGDDTDYDTWDVYYYDYDYIMDSGGDDTGTLYRNPYITWGANMTSVRNYMSGYELFYETETILGYEGVYKEDFTAYYFSSDTKKLYSSYVCIAWTSVAKSTIQNKIVADGYEYVNTTSDGALLYLSSNGKTVVVIEEDSEYQTYDVFYYDYNYIVGSDSRRQGELLAGETVLPIDQHLMMEVAEQMKAVRPTWRLARISAKATRFADEFKQ